MAGIVDGTGVCVHRFIWTSRYTHAYLKLLERKGLRPVRLLHISVPKAIELAENDRIPKEPSITHKYKYKYIAPEYT
jgi:hypothetical protein